MKVLIVYAHPRNESFSHAILERVSETLEKNNHTVTIRDLYAMNFNPVLSAEEAIHVVDGKFVRDNDVFPHDVQIEMDYIKESDILMYIYPVWWNGFPAILKGYVERVFQHGFAYSFESDEPKKIFAGKKALFIHCTGQPQESEASKELTRIIKEVTSGWMFNSNNVELLDHLVYGRVPYQDRETLSHVLDEIQTVIEKI
ncbi:flavoprotein [Erysipelothrix larvae]|uniref:Flavoprotein n=1 Tax=Erysipelothrix larvae TaxID=1514105 RepID=A0A0X8H0C8_9FIRM|nr:NAD(P)H-dependent oxidoreductase [Erysipelothrix larvae]AMC93747.1 flavoprotein [Erysipelothrix larvae]